MWNNYVNRAWWRMVFVTAAEKTADTRARSRVVQRSGRCSSGLSTVRPITGAKSTATNQEKMSATLVTAKIVQQYSPASLRARPTGIKPQTVTSVPVSIGTAVAS